MYTSDVAWHTEHYGSPEAALMGVAEALREEYKTIVDAGLSVQVDDAFIPFMYDVLVPPGTMEDYLAWAQPRIDAVNHALEGIPEDKVRYHICWGSWNGPHTNDIPLRDVLGLLLQVNAGMYLFEAANPRHEHEWRVWEDVDLPDGKILAPGVISHATNVVEHPELVAERLERIARIVGPDRVVGSTDCGFAQIAFTQRVHPEIQWAELRALVEGAQIASGDSRPAACVLPEDAAMPHRHKARKSPAWRGFPSAPERTRTTTSYSLTRPSTSIWGCQMRPQAAKSAASYAHSDVSDES